MKNKDIILIILVIIVLYLLFCDYRKNKEIKELKENFSATSDITTSGVTTTSTPILKLENISMERLKSIIEKEVNNRITEKDNMSIIESIKNLGIIAKKLNNKELTKLPNVLETQGIRITNDDESTKYDLKIVNGVLVFSKVGNDVSELIKTNMGKFNEEQLKNINEKGSVVIDAVITGLTGDLTRLNGDLVINNNLVVDGKIDVKDKIISRGNIWIEQNKSIAWQDKDGYRIGSYIKGKDNGAIDINIGTDFGGKNQRGWVNFHKIDVANDLQVENNIKVLGSIIFYFDTFHKSNKKGSIINSSNVMMILPPENGLVQVNEKLFLSS